MRSLPPQPRRCAVRHAAGRRARSVCAAGRQVEEESGKHGALSVAAVPLPTHGCACLGSQLAACTEASLGLAHKSIGRSCGDQSVHTKCAHQMSCEAPVCASTGTTRAGPSSCPPAGDARRPREHQAPGLCFVVRHGCVSSCTRCGQPSLPLERGLPWDKLWHMEPFLSFLLSALHLSNHRKPIDTDAWAFLPCLRIRACCQPACRSTFLARALSSDRRQQAGRGLGVQRGSGEGHQGRVSGQPTGGRSLAAALQGRVPAAGCALPLHAVV